jgi:hypothetical protein
MGGFEKDPEIICSPSFHQRELALVEGRSVPPGTDRDGKWALHSLARFCSTRLGCWDCWCMLLGCWDCMLGRLSQILKSQLNSQIPLTTSYTLLLVLWRRGDG